MPKVALVHDWLVGMRGGEYVLDAIAELFPNADLFTLIVDPTRISPRLRERRITTSFLQRLPGAVTRYRHFLPLMPAAIERLDVSGYDLVLSSSHCVAKGVRRGPRAVHVAYVHAPMRYIWDRYDEYFGPGRASPAVRLAAAALRPALQRWDRRVSQVDRVDRLIGNSRFIAERIADAYGRAADVIYPFADLERFRDARTPGERYLMVGAFAPNKRVDLAIEAFNQLELPLDIVGGGQEAERLHRLAGPSVRFLGAVSNAEIERLYARARAFIFPGLDDAGITPIEAMAAGVPVIAYGAGGALETVTPETGLFFAPQTPTALAEAVREFERDPDRFTEAACRARAARFSRAQFQREYLARVRETWTARGRDPGELA